jgi:hypothetical protein
MFVWYAGKDDVRFRFYVDTSVRTETRIRPQMKADIFFTDGQRSKKKFEVLTEADTRRKYFQYANDVIYFDEFLAPSVDEFVQKFNDGELVASDVYATLDKYSRNIAFEIDGKLYRIVEEPHLKCDLAHTVHFTDGEKKRKMYMDELVLALTYKDIVPIKQIN